MALVHNSRTCGSSRKSHISSVVCCLETHWTWFPCCYCLDNTYLQVWLHSSVYWNGNTTEIFIARFHELLYQFCTKQNETYLFVVEASSCVAHFPPRHLLKISYYMFWWQSVIGCDCGSRITGIGIVVIEMFYHVFFPVISLLYVFSLLSHKEFRFLMGLLPLVIHVCGCAMHQLLDVPCSETTAAGSSTHGNQPSNGLSRTRKESHAHWKTFVIVCLISMNLPIALYTCLIHQRGTIDVMTFLYAEAQKPVSNLMHVLFLMPCHSTPFYRYKLWKLDVLNIYLST